MAVTSEKQRTSGQETQSQIEQRLTSGQDFEQRLSRSCSTNTVPSEQLSAVSEECCGTFAEDSIREKAYLLWEEAGRPEGDGSDFWIQAEKAISK